ncbi:MAG: rubredoxin [Desulforhopalus sp.]
MDKRVSSICGYVYEPAKGDADNGVAPKTIRQDVPHDWVCLFAGRQKVILL